MPSTPSVPTQVYQAPLSKEKGEVKAEGAFRWLKSHTIHSPRPTLSRKHVIDKREGVKTIQKHLLPNKISQWKPKYFKNETYFFFHQETIFLAGSVRLRNTCPRSDCAFALRQYLNFLTFRRSYTSLGYRAYFIWQRSTPSRCCVFLFHSFQLRCSLAHVGMLCVQNSQRITG